MGVLCGRRPLTWALSVVAVLGVLGAGVAGAQPGAPTPAGPVSGVPGGLAPTPPPIAPSATPCATATVAGDTAISLTSGGATRIATLHVPATAAGHAIPLIIAYHGYGSNGRDFSEDSGLSTLGDQRGYAVVYPTSLGPQWAISKSERDIVFAGALLDRVESMACIDSRHVYATGVSIGAGMAARTGCELSERIAALVLVSGGYRSLPACQPDRPLSVLEIHGTADTTVPYSGSGPNHAGAVLPYVTAWAARDHCAPRPTKTVVAQHTVLYHWGGCASGAVVEHLRIYGGGHGLPNATGLRITSGHTSTINGLDNIWHFLASRSLGQPFPEAPAPDAGAP